MYPNPPYPGFTWPLFQHTGPLRNPKTLFQTLLAAAMYRDSHDPDAEITNYLVANSILTPNVRSDSGQADAWRDYQQILSELGLIYSTRVERTITPTPLGLNFLDGTLSFAEVLTLQAFRYQYPNGHKVTISDSLRKALRGTPFANTPTLAELQQATGVQIRPAVLVWRVLRQLTLQKQNARLSVDEVRTYLMRCATHADTSACVNAMIAARSGGVTLPPMERGSRNAQDWLNLLRLTPLFSGKGGRSAYIEISSYGTEHALEIDEICAMLESSASFWEPGTLDTNDKRAWYADFGSLSVSIALIPPVVSPGTTISPEEPDTKEAEAISVRKIALREFDPTTLGSLNQDTTPGRSINSSYDAGMANNKHRLHDLMVIYIARTCRENGARVYDDPNTVDLLVDYEGLEYIVEVKTVTPRNFVGRIRYALGQVLEYDYLRSLQVQGDRRKVIAIAAQITPASWHVPYLTEHLDVDLLSLDGQALRIDTRLPTTRNLFTPTSSNYSLTDA